MKAYYTTHEVAQLLMVTFTTIIKYCNEGKLKCSKTVGGHRRITSAQLMDFVNEFDLQDDIAFITKLEK